jgi:hypothetical protein
MDLRSDLGSDAIHHEQTSEEFPHCYLQAERGRAGKQA